MTAAHRIPPSRVLARIDAAMAATRQPLALACLRAERAGHLARQGQIEVAREEIRAVHALFDRQPQAAVSAWLSLAEGLLAYFTNLSADARDKFQRSHAISRACGMTDVQALGAAWLAHMAYTRFDVAALAQYLAESLQLADPEQRNARARACLVAGTAYHFGERQDRAQVWYARAREAATREGDEATLSALAHNMAWHRGNQAVQAAVFGGDVDDQARHAQAGAETSVNFDKWMGHTSLDALAPVLCAMVASAQGRHADALALYDKHVAQAERQGLGRMRGNFLVDMAWCHWHVGNVELAHSLAAEGAQVLATEGADMHADDRAVAHGRMARLRALMGQADGVAAHEQQAQVEWAAHRALQRRLVAALEQALPAP
jgi:hypothetical protein